MHAEVASPENPPRREQLLPLAPGTICTAGAGELSRGPKMSQLSPKSHGKSLTKAIRDSSHVPPFKQRDTAASPTHPAILLVITDLMKHLQLINCPQGLSYTRGWLGAPISSCKVKGAASGAGSEQTGMIHPPISYISICRAGVLLPSPLSGVTAALCAAPRLQAVGHFFPSSC